MVHICKITSHMIFYSLGLILNQKEYKVYQKSINVMAVTFHTVIDFGFTHKRQYTDDYSLLFIDISYN